MNSKEITAYCGECGKQCETVIRYFEDYDEECLKCPDDHNLNDAGVIWKD